MHDHAKSDKNQQPGRDVDGTIGRFARRVRIGGVMFGLMIGSMSLIMGCGSSSKTETLDVQTHVESADEAAASDAAQREVLKTQSSEGQSPY